MQFGICGGPEVAGLAIQAGYDYFEWSVGGLLKPREDKAAFSQALAEVRQTGLTCPAVNVFIPADLKVTGPSTDLASLEAYITTAFHRANLAGVKTIVFGSGGARRIPEGFDRAEARNQLVAFCRMLAPVAQSQGVTVVIEPLNLAECNVLTTVGECARLVRQVNQPAIRLLVDAYHLLRDGDVMEDILANRDILAHVHVATIPNRLAPGLEACALEPFFGLLARSGYDGRVSIEGKLPDNAADLTHSLALMMNWMGI
jgi:sugar phosphate isomerase/epimerase